MSTMQAEAREGARETTVADRIADAVRHATHVSHEARLIGSMARDAGEEGVHAAKRAIRGLRRQIEAAEDVRDDAAHYVRRHPLGVVGAAAGVGLACGWLGGRFARRTRTVG